ncbi:MAG: hypothetical protein AAGM22_30315, partial [Acidobacteriota bacterium]
AIGGGVAGFIAGTVMCNPCDNTTSRKRRRGGKWKCTARCHVKDFSGVSVGSGFVTGFGTGPSRSMAAQAAMANASSNTPPGTHARHCRATRCWR